LCITIFHAYNNIEKRFTNRFTSRYNDKIIDKVIKITLFECSYDSFTLYPNPRQYGFYCDNIKVGNGGKGKFLNVYDNFYVHYLEIQKKKQEIQLLENNIQIDINDNKLIINTYHKEHLDLADYIPIKIKKNY
jgi:hypothetical protein